MNEAMLTYQPPDVSPPGETLRDLMEERALSQAELARRLGRPSQAINEIIAGKKEITEDTALELERVLQVPAHFWLAREARYREFLARQRDERSREQQLPWVNQFPLKALQEAGQLPAGRLTPAFKTQLVDPLLRFFGVASPEGFKAQYGQMQTQFRFAKPKQQTDTAAISAWLRMGELAAAALPTAPYSAAKFEAALPAMRAFTVRPAPEIGPALVALSAAVGVALVFVPALPGTHVSGVARWLNGKPLIQLSLLGKWNDAFWFSFFHEVGHILKHPVRSVFLDDSAAADAVQSPEEQEANRFAEDMLLPKALRQELQALPLTQASVQAFAKKAQIHPGIVVGQLQHRGRIGYGDALTKLKQRYEHVAA